MTLCFKKYFNQRLKMINSKNILIAILAFIIIKVGLDYKETVDIVNQTNDTFHGNKNSDAVLRTAYGTSDLKKIHQIKEKREKSEALMIDETMLSISGRIDENTSYMMETQYSATSKDKSCQKTQTTLFSSGSVPIGESFEYFPTIKGTHHEIKIPLKLFNPNECCKIKIKRIYIDIFNREDKKEHNRMILYTSVKNEYADYGFKKSWHNTYKLNMECIEPGPSESTHYTPCGFGSISNRTSIMGVIPNTYFKVELNIKKIPVETLSKEEIHYILSGEGRRR